MGLKTGTSGPNDQHPKVLIRMADEIVNALKVIIQNSENIPVGRRIVNEIVLFKNGRR